MAAAAARAPSPRRPARRPTTRSPTKPTAWPRPARLSTRRPTPSSASTRTAARPPATASLDATPSTSAGSIPTSAVRRRATARTAARSRRPLARCSPSTRSATCTPRRVGPKIFGPTTSWAGRSMGCSPGCSVPTNRPRGCRRSWADALPPPVSNLRRWRRPAPPGTTSSPTNSMGRRPPARRPTVPASPSPSSISTNPPARPHATTLPVATPSSTAGEIPHTRAGRPVTSAPAETSMRPPVP
mmetsp:Transcript_3887/g.9106  ORF Transcript_3887/g.9106 Transcript_3887/m.9106 type:complete len:243 (+) Transcript_3887:507-1235(+)